MSCYSQQTLVAILGHTSCHMKVEQAWGKRTEVEEARGKGEGGWGEGEGGLAKYLNFSH